MIRKAHGFALIDLLFVIGIIGVLTTIALPRLAAAKQSAGATSAVATLRLINSAQLTFAITCGSGFYAPDLSSLGLMPPGSNQPFIASELATANIITKSGYIFEVSGTAYPLSPASCNGMGAGLTAQAYKVRADPVDATNPRFFGTNASGTIYEDTASLWGTMPEAAVPPSGHPIY
jgi:type II secretory pathway pseudopilin PulG